MNDFDEESEQGVTSRTALVDHLEAIIKQAVPVDRDLVDQPAVLAELLGRFGHDPRDFQSCTFEAMLGTCVGRAVAHETENLVWLADTLHAQGYTEDNQYDFFHADRYSFSLMNTEKKKVFAMRTQNVNYLVVLCQRFQKWEVHLRQWWEALPLASDKYLPYGLDAYIKGATMTLEDAITLGKRLEQYSDDIPGMSFPERIPLSAFRNTGFSVGKDGACAGLRYADARDRGYIATVKVSVFGIPEADKMSWNSLARVHYVWYDLLSAIDTFRADAEEANNRPEGSQID